MGVVTPHEGPWVRFGYARSRPNTRRLCAKIADQMYALIATDRSARMISPCAGSAKFSLANAFRLFRAGSAGMSSGKNAVERDSCTGPLGQ